MNKAMRIASLLVLSLFAFISMPIGAMAQNVATGSETVTLLINVTTPAGTQIIGTAVANRQCGNPTLTGIKFTGTINGKLATAEGSATEQWSSNSAGELKLAEPTVWDMASLAKPGGFTLNVVQTSPGLITVNGIPLAIEGDLTGPCTGPTTGSRPNNGQNELLFAGRTYVVTNAGQGATEVVFLPHTGDGPIILHPLMIVGMMMVPGFALVILSTTLRKFANKQGSRASR